MSEERPNPDALLAEVSAAQRKQTRGRLKVFFGAAPGVGKTFAMLEEGRKRAAEGMDVVVGYAEPHARMETEALLIGLELLPFRKVEYRSSVLREFDLDAALARRPHLILVDELAHTNAPGSRHAKRWQDVAELLDAGIHVYTTLNVQHLESQNDVVERITGVKVRETLPDAVLEQADEIELIDTAPEELLERFREGKVYRPEQAERAARHFFTKGNLIALREIALRRTAERVDQQMQDFRRDNRVGSTWAASERILVCVGPSPLSARLVRSARRLAAGLHAPWIAAFVEKPGRAMPAEARRRLDANLKLAQDLGAEIATLAGANLAQEITAFARRRNVTKIVIGKPLRPRWMEVLFGSAVDDLIRHSGEIDVHVIRGEEEPASASRPAAGTSDSGDPVRQPLPYRDFTLSALTVALASAVGFPLYHHWGLSNTNVLMLYLLAVLWSATRYARWAAVAAAALGVLAFDFLFVPPEFSFSVNDRQYVITFVVMMITAVLISTLTHRLRDQAQAARVREQRAGFLYALTRDLAAARSPGEIASAVSRHAVMSLGRKVALLVSAGGADDAGRLVVVPGSSLTIAAKEMATAQWAYEHRQPAGRGTATLPQSAATFVPLSGDGSGGAGGTGLMGMSGAAGGGAGVAGEQGAGGLLAVDADEGVAELTHGQRQLLESIATQAGLAMDRIRLADEARTAWEKVESELLRNTLLSGVSHELRTPLATITGALGTATDPGSPVPEAERRQLLGTALEEAQRMDRLINNLLEMTRLESGGLRLRREACSAAELVASAVGHLSARLGSREVNVRLPDDLPDVFVDALMFEQVLMNLLDNAVQYTPPGSPIDISGSALAGEFRLDVADRGPGLRPGTHARVFEKFFRDPPVAAGQADEARAARGSGGRGGIGLGLAICRGIIEAHGGRIAAYDRAGGGATFTITLPLERTA